MRPHAARLPRPTAYWCLLLLLRAADALTEAPLSYRLPGDALPEAYDLLLLTNVTRGSRAYEGHLTLRLRVLRPTRRLVLHAHELKVRVEKTRLQEVTGQGSHRDVPVAAQETDDKHQLHVLRFPKDVPVGRYILDLHFNAQIREDLFGFYRSSYRDNGEVRWMAVTQFSPTHARSAFPCMDEPAFKATFQLRIGHYDNETVTSNTLPELRVTTSRPGYQITSFMPTPRMPTYIFGWAVHGFERLNSTDRRFWLWHRPLPRSKKSPSSPNILLTEGPLLYSALERWMPLSNPLPHFQQIAVPDFNFQAMENWGMVTFREPVALAQRESTPPVDILNKLESIGHEYAHTWFGNIVSPGSWDVAWLKEGFATYFSYQALKAVRPNWPIQDVFTSVVVHSSLRSDQMEHNLVLNGNSDGSPQSAMAALNFVAYDKGASVIRMIADVMGEDRFKTAMHSYLKEMQYEAAQPEDLYRHLDLAASPSPRALTPVPFSKILDSWATQPNYPVIRVSRASPGRLRISQEPFILGRMNSSSPKATTWWWVPVRLANFRKPQGDALSWLGAEDLILTETSAWHIVNPLRMGVYRVTYSPENWQALADVLHGGDFRRLAPISRAALLDDAFNFAQTGYESYALALDLARYLSREDEYAPWAAATNAIHFLNSKLWGRPLVYEAFRRYAIELITPIYQKLTFVVKPFDTYIKNMHRNTILETACLLNLDDCVSQAKLIFNDWIVNANKSVAGHLKNFVYRVGIVHGTDDDWKSLWQRFLEENEQSDKVLLISALARTENPYFINEYLEYMLKYDSGIAKQYDNNMLMIQSLVDENSKNIYAILEYMQANFKRIIDLKGETLFNQIFSVIGAVVTCREQEKKLIEFINRNSALLGGALKSAKIAIKSARDNIAWIDKYAPHIDSYLQCHNINCTATI